VLVSQKDDAMREFDALDRKAKRIR